MKTTNILLGMTFMMGLFLSNASSQVFKTKEMALRDTFADTDTVVRKVLYLTDTQIDKIEKKARVKLDSKLVTYYQGFAKSKSVGFAFIETNIVRTKPETFLVRLNPDASVASVEILAFYEPADYLPTSNWLKLFDNKKLDDNLWPKRGIHNITGATLTVRSITRGVRKILAIFEEAVVKKETFN